MAHYTGCLLNVKPVTTAFESRCEMGEPDEAEVNR